MAAIPAFRISSPAQRLPLPVLLERNQVLTRTLQEVLSTGVPSIVAARNLPERAEHAIDQTNWTLLGLFTPTILKRLFPHTLVPRLLLAPLRLPQDATPLNLPWQFLDAAHHRQWQAAPPQERQALNEALQSVGLRGLQDLTPAFINRLRGLKLGVLATDMVMINATAQTFFWSRNWVTRKVTGKNGYTGEFNYADAQTLDTTAAPYYRHRLALLAGSLGVSLGSTMAITATILALLRSTKAAGPGLVGQLKQALHNGFNHEEGIYMSKWALSLSYLFNYNLPALFASRDRHERREYLIESIASQCMFTLGDDFITGGLAKHLDRISNQGAKVGILAKTPGPFNLPRLAPLHEIWKRHGTQSLPFRLASLNFWAGFIGPCAAINLAVPILNNLCTYSLVVQAPPAYRSAQTFLGFAPIAGQLHTGSVSRG
jgi:hypothetical protein